MKTCNHCGNLWTDHRVYCPACGKAEDSRPAPCSPLERELVEAFEAAGTFEDMVNDDGSLNMDAVRASNRLSNAVEAMVSHIKANASVEADQKDL